MHSIYVKILACRRSRLKDTNQQYLQMQTWRLDKLHSVVWLIHSQWVTLAQINNSALLGIQWNRPAQVKTITSKSLGEEHMNMVLN